MKGVVVEKFEDGVDFNSAEGRKLKYYLLDMQEHDISDFLSLDLLRLICSDPDNIDYPNLPVDEEERYMRSSWKHITPSVMNRT